MSLINEALKKAQRLRSTEQTGDTTPGFPTEGRVTKRGQARSSQTIVLIASGAIVLVVLSVVATFWLINRPAPPPQRTVVAPKSGVKNEPTPALVPPVIKPAVPGPETTSSNPGPSAGEIATRTAEAKKPEVATSSPETKPDSPVPTATVPPPGSTASTSASAPVQPASAAPVTSPAPLPASGAPKAPASTDPAALTAAPATSTSGPGQPDERIAAFLDSVRVTAIRASANDSKVFMNDKVYRVNDLVERTLGIRLVKVAADSLTFADANGVTYVKYF